MTHPLVKTLRPASYSCSDNTISYVINNEDFEELFDAKCTLEIQVGQGYMDYPKFILIVDNIRYTIYTRWDFPVPNIYYYFGQINNDDIDIHKYAI